MAVLSFYQPRRKKIGLTALIDVVFILLMFFMLTSSFSHWRAIDLNLPVQAAESIEPSVPQLLVLLANKELYLYGTDFRLNHFADLSQTHLAAFDRDQPLVVIPQSDTEVEAIVQLLSHLNLLGFKRTSLGDLLPEEVAL